MVFHRIQAISRLLWQLSPQNPPALDAGQLRVIANHDNLRAGNIRLLQQAVHGLVSQHGRLIDEDNRLAVPGLDPAAW